MTRPGRKRKYNFIEDEIYFSYDKLYSEIVVLLQYIRYSMVDNTYVFKMKQILKTDNSEIAPPDSFLYYTAKDLSTDLVVRELTPQEQILYGFKND